MERVITYPTGLNVRDLDNYDWDIIKTNITVDIPAIQEWAKHTMEMNKDSAFDWTQTYLMSERIQAMVKEKIAEGAVWGFPKNWTLQWATQRSNPIPNPFLCDTTIFPEVTSASFYEDINKDLEQYNNGFYKKIKDTLDVNGDCYRMARLFKMEKNEGASPHYDVESGFSVRMHIQVNASPDCVWTFGDNQDRTYRMMETGHVYLVNTAVFHSAINEGNDPWIIIYNNPADEAITRLLNTTLHISP